MLTSQQPRFHDRHRAPHRVFAVAALVCLALLALLSVAQVTHTHAANTNADTCQLCTVLHSAAPAVAAAAVLVLLLVAAAVPAPELAVVPRLWHAQLYTRPPPDVSGASFHTF